MRIIIGGDFTTTSRGEEAVLNKSAFSEDVVNLMRSADISMLNMEAPIADVSDKKIKKIGPHLRTIKETVAFFKECGVDVVTLANNHFYDYGDVGVTKTIDALITNDIDFVGGGRDKNEYRKILYKEVHGKTIAVLNYCESEFSVNESIGSNPLNPINTFYDINVAKQKADYILVITHGGVEGYNLPTPRMQELYRYFIDIGANIVVNGHQHCYSGYEKYNDGLIFYGLGNLFFDLGKSWHDGWNEGFILELELQDNNCSFVLYPYLQCLSSFTSVKLVDGSMKDDFYKKVEDLNNMILNPNKLEKLFHEYCFKKRRNQLSWFAPYTNRYLLALYRRRLLPSFLSKNKMLQIQNMLRCESHREVCLNCLKQN